MENWPLCPYIFIISIYSPCKLIVSFIKYRSQDILGKNSVSLWLTYVGGWVKDIYSWPL